MGFLANVLIALLCAQPAPYADYVRGTKLFSRGIRIGTLRLRNRTLDPAYDWPTSGTQCSLRGRLPTQLKLSAAAYGSHPAKFDYTPVRTWAGSGSSSPGAAAVVLLLYRRRRTRDFATSRLKRDIVEGWHDHFLYPHQTKLIILLDQRVGGRVRAGDLAAVANKLGLVQADCARDNATANSCAALRKMDGGYALYTLTSPRTPGFSHVLLGATHVRLPEWAANMSVDALDRWRTPGCIHAPIEYVIGCAWYVHDMMRLRVLDFFDFVYKVDDDIGFVRRMPEDPAALMASEHKLFFKTSPDNARDSAICAVNSLAFQTAYLRAEGARCGDGRGLRARGEGAPSWQEDTVSVYGNFVGMWLGYFASPQLLHFSDAWLTYPNGTWVYRWTDQQYWPRALALVDEGGPSAARSTVNRQEWRDHRDLHCFYHKKPFKKIWPMDAPPEAADASARGISGRTGGPRVAAVVVVGLVVVGLVSRRRRRTAHSF